MPTPQEIAKRSIAAMSAKDAVFHAFDMAIENLGPGTATVSMRVRADMLNGHGTCHGGMTYILADTAFGFACNGRNQVAVAQHAAMDYIAPAHEGELLTATARERASAGRSGVFDVTVTNERGTVAEFRGLSRTVRGTHFED